MAEKKNANIVELDLPCPIDAVQLQRRSALLARAELEMKLLDDERREAAAGFSKRLKKARENIQKLAHEVNEEAELRPVRCRIEPDFNRLAIVTIRLDTSEVVEDRAMTDEERQGSLHLEAPPKKKRRGADANGDAAEVR